MYTTDTIDAAARDGDRAMWMLNSLLVERATAEQTNGAFTLLEQWLTPEGNPPPHVHTHEDESFLVMEGNVEVTVGDTTTVLGPGDFAFAPRGVPHGYAVREGLAHIYVIVTPGGLERFFRKLGEPAGAMSLPAPAEPDVPFVISTAAAHDITILPPPGA